MAIEREHVLHPVEPLQVVGDEDPEQREQDHALGGTEVAAVDPGEEHPEPQLDATVLDHPAASLGDETAEPGLEDHQHHRQQDQHRDHAVEHRARQREQEHPTGDPADERGRAEDHRAAALTAELAPVADRAAHAAEADAHRVADVGDDRRVADGEQGGEGDERARAHDRVDGAGEETGADHEQRFEDRHGVRHRRLLPVPDEKPPVEKAVELLVYAPVGMALYVRDMLPSMMGIFVSRGKREVQSHRTPPPPPTAVPPVPPEVKRRIDESVGMARVVAEGGFGVAREVAGSGIGVARDVAGNALSQFLALRTNGTEPEPPPPPPRARAGTCVERTGRATGAARRRVASPTSPAADALPIPDYDELSASQVVERLDGLDRESLEAIRRYETDHRGRNTILGKIAQLS